MSLRPTSRRRSSSSMICSSRTRWRSFTRPRASPAGSSPAPVHGKQADRHAGPDHGVGRDDDRAGCRAQGPQSATMSSSTLVARSWSSWLTSAMPLGCTRRMRPSSRVLGIWRWICTARPTLARVAASTSAAKEEMDALLAAERGPWRRGVAGVQPEPSSFRGGQADQNTPPEEEGDETGEKTLNRKYLGNG